jgi:tripartite-type tricarboxylate transporter receptor subunit TctC
MNRRIFLTAATTAVLGIGALSSALAQSASSRPIRVVLVAAPGGAMDVYARLVSEHMAKALGRTIIVEYKPGANGNIAYRFVANAPADGELILVGTQATSEINPSSFSQPGWSLNDFNPLIRGVTAPLVLVAHPSVPAKTLPELVAWIRKNPGKLSYSSYTAGTPSHFLGSQLNQRFGLDLVHVPQRNSGAQATEMIAGHVRFGFAQMQTTLPHINAGRLNALAVTSAARSRFLPHVPSFKELGHDEFTAAIWFGLLIRAGTPPSVVASLLNAARAAHADPDVKAKLEAQGFDVSGQSGPEFEADIRAQIERWSHLVKGAGFKVD